VLEILPVLVDFLLTADNFSHFRDKSLLPKELLNPRALEVTLGGRIMESIVLVVRKIIEEVVGIHQGVLFLVVTPKRLAQSPSGVDEGANRNAWKFLTERHVHPGREMHPRNVAFGFWDVVQHLHKLCTPRVD